MPKDEGPRACAICGRILDWSAAGGYMHNLQDGAEELDHEALPIPTSEMPGQVRGRCDFCSDDDPHWELPARDFEMPGAPAGSIGDWAACDRCADMIRKNAWTALTKRSIVGYNARNPEMMLTPAGEQQRMHRQLRMNITGPIRELTPF